MLEPRPSTGRRSDADNLSRVVSKLSDPKIGITLFGLGLGPKTDHVGKFYPNSVVNIDPDAFATEIGNLLRRQMSLSIG